MYIVHIHENYASFAPTNLSSLEHADLMESKTWITGRNAPSEIDTVARFKNDIKAFALLDEVYVEELHQSAVASDVPTTGNFSQNAEEMV